MAEVALGWSSADFQSAVSQGFQPARRVYFDALWRGSDAADWKSAIQQIENLRYAAVLPPVLLQEPALPQRLSSHSELGQFVVEGYHGEQGAAFD